MLLSGIEPLAAAFFGALIGAVVGSFLGCVYYRVPRRISLSAHRSFCPHCQQAVPWYRNIPVLSWLLLRGRTPCCQQPLAPSYLLCELFGLIIGALLGYFIGLGAPFIVAIVVLLLGTIYELLRPGSDK